SACDRPSREGGEASGRSDSPLGSDPRDGRQVSPCGAASGRRNGTQRVLRPRVRTMKVTSFQDTDTLFVEFRPGDIAETRDLDENTQLDVDAEGKIRALTLEHARERADLHHFSFDQIGT